MHPAFVSFAPVNDKETNWPSDLDRDWKRTTWTGSHHDTHSLLIAFVPFFLFLLSPFSFYSIFLVGGITCGEYKTRDMVYEEFFRLTKIQFSLLVGG